MRQIRQFPPVLLFIPLLLLCALFLFPTAASAKKPKIPYKVTATVGMVADIISEIAGDRAKVKHIIGAGVDPHSFTPTRSDVAALLKADVVFYSGLLLEGQMTQILKKVGKRRPVFAVTEAIDRDWLIGGADGVHGDPHVWMDVQGWMKAVEAATKSLIEFDPDGAAVYKQNSDAYLIRLKQLDEYARKVLGSIPEDKRIMVTAHDAFNYMGRAYRLDVVGIQGLSTESEAGLKDINRLVDLLVEKKIPAVFVETSVSDKNVNALIEGAASRGHEVVIGGSLFSDAMGPSGSYEGSYIGMIDHNVTIIARALGGTAPEGGMDNQLGAK